MVDDKKQFVGHFDGVESVLFCDETKFSKNDGNYDNAIVYLAVATEKRQNKLLIDELQAVLNNDRVKLPVFHASEVFKREAHLNLIPALAEFIVRHKLRCFCLKYNKDLLFEPTKRLQYLNSDIHRFDRHEYQAVFYFITFFNTYLQIDQPDLLKRQLIMFFDRNVYGRNGETQDFSLPQDKYIIKRLSFTDKANLPLLALPDYFGYIYRKTKISQNRADAGDTSIETSPTVIRSYEAFLRIQKAGLFYHLTSKINWINMQLF